MVDDWSHDVLSRAYQALVGHEPLSNAAPYFKDLLAGRPPSPWLLNQLIRLLEGADPELQLKLSAKRGRPKRKPWEGDRQWFEARERDLLRVVAVERLRTEGATLEEAAEAHGLVPRTYNRFLKKIGLGSGERQFASDHLEACRRFLENLPPDDK